MTKQPFRKILIYLGSENCENDIDCLKNIPLNKFKNFLYVKKKII
jgi:hypothetical protein